MKGIPQMKIAVTSYGEDRKSKADFSFGRCKYFIVIDTETEAVAVHRNDQNLQAAQGAGIQAARNMANLDVTAVLTGNVGPNAFRTLKAAGIEIHLFPRGTETVEEALSLWKQGETTEATAATVEGHWI